MSGLRLVNNIEKYVRPPGQPEYNKGYGEVSLRSGEQFTLQGRQGNGNYFYCLVWQTQYGGRSVEVTGLVRQYDESRLQAVTPGDICVRGGDYNVTFKSYRDQVVRWSLVLQRAWQRNEGTTRPVCRDCGSVPTFNEVSSEKAVQTRGMIRLVIAGTLAAGAWTAYVGLATAIGILYNFGRIFLPSRRAQKVQQEFDRARKGNTFDTRKTRSYDQPAENAFRRQQDIDDMSDLTEMIRWETERLRTMEARLRKKHQQNYEDREQLVREYEEAVERVKDLQRQAAQATQDEA